MVTTPSPSFVREIAQAGSVVKWWTVFSNLSAIPSCIQLLRKRAWVEALVVLQAGGVSAAYHVYDAKIIPRDPNWYPQLNEGDHLNAILTVMTIALYLLLDTHDRYHVLMAAMPGFLLFAADFGNLLFVFVWSLVVGLAGLAILWKKTRFSTDLDLKYLLLGLGSTILAGTAFYLGWRSGSSGVDPTYMAFHGTWHMFIFTVPYFAASAVGFSRRNADKQKRLGRLVVLDQPREEKPLSLEEGMDKMRTWFSQNVNFLGNRNKGRSNPPRLGALMGRPKIPIDADHLAENLLQVEPVPEAPEVCENITMEVVPDSDDKPIYGL